MSADEVREWEKTKPPPLVVVSLDVYNDRMIVCRKCSFCIGTYFGFMRCKKRADDYVRTFSSKERCPIGLWGPDFCCP